ncbi:hypothetical protein ABNM11_27275 [Pseudomonas syringae]
MKLKKSVLSILAFAISSSAFAENFSDGQSISQKMKYSLLTGKASYQVNLHGACESGQVITNEEQIRAQEEYVRNEIVIPFRKALCEKVFDIDTQKDLKAAIEMFNEIPGEIQTDVTKSNYLFGVSLSCLEINPLTHKLEVIGSSQNSAIRNGAIKAVAEFKAKENAKVIYEFNALQELALKESDPAIKNLIKQAADLKLASYKK